MTARPRPAFTPQALIWAGVAAAVGGIAWVKSINLLLLVAYLLVGVLAVNAFLAWRAVRRVTAARTPVPPVFAGETALVGGTVANTSRRAAAFALREVGPRRESATWFLPAAPPGGTAPFTRPHTFTRRGKATLPALRASSTFPFGLVEWVRGAVPAGEVTVLPALGRVDLPRFRRWLARAVAGDDLHRRVIRRVAAADGDVRGLRGYRPGDPTREIHWKTSARRGQLMVREYDDTAPQDLTLIVDPWTRSEADPTTAANLEWSLSLTVSVAWAWAHGDRPGELTLVVPTDGWVKRTGPGTPGFVRTGFAALADVRGLTTVSAPPSELLRGASRALRLVVSTRPASPLAADLRASRLSAAVAHPAIELDWYAPPPAAR